MVSAPFVGPSNYLSVCFIHLSVWYRRDRAKQLTVLKPATQVMKNKSVVGENHVAFMARLDSGDEEIFCRHISRVPKDRRVTRHESWVWAGLRGSQT